MKQLSGLGQGSLNLLGKTLIIDYDVQIDFPSIAYVAIYSCVIKKASI